MYIRCVSDISRLGKYRHNKVFKAGNGGPGESESRHGKTGEDCIIDLPRGSVVRGRESGIVHELLEVGESVLILKGGGGGLGNEHFKSSLNRSPQEATEGKKGESDTFDIELRLVVDAGIIGLPNAGKSSLLNALTRASSRVGSYAFTTLEPHLGAFEDYVLADIPGLIEGASRGKGLGHAFLRHMTRTRLILHCISLEGEDDVVARYETVRGELEAHGDNLPHKPEMIVLTKADEADDARIATAQRALAKFGNEILIVSVIDDGRLKVFRDRLREFLKRESTA